MGRSEFNAPLFSDSAVNQSSERLGTVGEWSVSVLSIATCASICNGGTKNFGKDRISPSLMIYLGTVDRCFRMLKCYF